MYCRKCGAELGEHDVFCPECGAAVHNDAKNPNKEQHSKSGSRTVIVLVSILIVLVVLGLAALIAYVFTNDRSTSLSESLAKQNMAASYTLPPVTSSPAPSPTPFSTPSSLPKSNITSTENSAPAAEIGYEIFTDKEYNFSCAYPEDFIKYNDNTATGRYTVKSPDGSGDLKICASKNSTNITIDQSMSVFKSKHGGTVEYESSGNTYYAVRLRNGEKYYYKYLKMANGNMYWFELEYPAMYSSIYDEYINSIYKSFTIN